MDGAVLSPRFSKVLVANRGEIACRIVGTLREMGIGSVAVCSEADRGARHTRVADEVRVIGPAEPHASYLNIEALIAAARESGAQAVHPGYGFLAENAAFADAVERAGLTFIGPTGDHIRAMGDKRAARALAVKAGVPVVPGAEGNDAGALAQAAARIGYPVMVKAALGGGGKGMRLVSDAAGLAEAIDSARRIAASAFGDDALYLEKQVLTPRHIEVQLLGDGRGAAIHLFERECSLQRRHQKVVEECPSTAVSEALRERITFAAVSLAQAVRYRGAGTVEFLLAPDESYYFLEMNTRLQVEHAVTELVTGLDLVRLQIEVAVSGALPIAQEAVVRRGHAIEARVYAEDAARGFLPQAGTTTRVRWPHAPFVRVDAGIEAGDAIPVHYDPILAKVVAWGEDRPRALGRLAQALDESLVQGVVTNLPLLRALARSPAVEQAAFDTEWIEREFLAGFAAVAMAPAPELAVAVAAVAEALGLARGAGVSLRAGGAGTGIGSASEPADAANGVFGAFGRWRQDGLA